MLPLLVVQRIAIWLPPRQTALVCKAWAAVVRANDFWFERADMRLSKEGALAIRASTSDPRNAYCRGISSEQAWEGMHGNMLFRFNNGTMYYEANGIRGVLQFLTNHMTRFLFSTDGRWVVGCDFMGVIHGAHYDDDSKMFRHVPMLFQFNTTIGLMAVTNNGQLIYSDEYLPRDMRCVLLSPTNDCVLFSRWNQYNAQQLYVYYFETHRTYTTPLPPIRIHKMELRSGHKLFFLHPFACFNGDKLHIIYTYSRGKRHAQSYVFTLTDDTTEGHVIPTSSEFGRIVSYDESRLISASTLRVHGHSMLTQYLERPLVQ